MIKKYWTHEPLPGLFETYDSDSFLSVIWGWIVAKFFAAVIILVIIYLISLI
jgi:hypothetical protein